MTKGTSFDHHVSEYLDNEISVEQFALFSDQLSQDASLRKRFLQLSALDYAIQQVADHQDRQNYIEAVLGQAEQKPEDDFIFELYKTLETPTDEGVKHHLQLRDVLSLTGYLAGRALHDRRVMKGLTAAILALGVLLYISLSGPSEEPGDLDVAKLSIPENGALPEPAPLVPVATITAEHDAVWDRRPGQDLYAGQRFTLTQGFAEITTKRGAIAILEAPATIELLNNDNAIRLHTGKLVGICQTDESKGFWVRTPVLDIVDLGTRFGVDASGSANAEVHVMEGEVAANAPSSTQTSSKRRVLYAGQALAADQSATWTMLPVDPTRFTSSVDPDNLQPRMSGAPAVWSSEMPGNLQATQQQSDSLQVYLERRGVVLQDNIPVNILPGETALAAEAGVASDPRMVLAGQRVSVYIIHLDSANFIEKSNYSIHFNQPVLGVICKDPYLEQTDQTLGSPGTVYPDIRKVTSGPSPRGIDFGATAVQNEPNDSLQCDEHTLHLTLSQLHYVDQIRVLVKDPRP